MKKYIIFFILLFVSTQIFSQSKVKDEKTNVKFWGWTYFVGISTFVNNVLFNDKVILQDTTVIGAAADSNYLYNNGTALYLENNTLGSSTFSRLKLGSGATGLYTKNYSLIASEGYPSDRSLQFTGNALFNNNVSVTGTATLQDTTTFNSYIRQIKNCDVLTTTNDTIYGISLTVNPTLDYNTTSRTQIPLKIDLILNENGSYRMGKNRWNNLKSEATNYNDSIDVLYSGYFQTTNNQGYINQQTGIGGFSYINADAADRIGGRANTANLYSANFGQQVVNGNTYGHASTAIAGKSYSINITGTYGGYFKTTVDSVMGINISHLINAKTVADTTYINTYKGINIDTYRGGTGSFIVGKRIIDNMYGINIVNRSGVYGKDKHYGIYENFGKNFFTNSITSASHITTSTFYYVKDSITPFHYWKGTMTSGVMVWTDTGSTNIP